MGLRMDGRLWKTMVGMRSDAGFPIAEGLDNSQYGSILMEGILMRWYCAETFVILLSCVLMSFVSHMVVFISDSCEAVCLMYCMFHDKPLWLDGQFSLAD